MKRSLACCIVLIALPSMTGVAAADPATPRRPGDSMQPAAAATLKRSRQAELVALLDGLARQIAEINANLPNLGSRNAAALRFLTTSLTAYQRAWGELNRDQVDFAAPVGAEAVATLAEAQPSCRSGQQGRDQQTGRLSLCLHADLLF